LENLEVRLEAIKDLARKETKIHEMMQDKRTIAPLVSRLKIGDILPEGYDVYHSLFA